MDELLGGELAKKNQQAERQKRHQQPLRPADQIGPIARSRVNGVADMEEDQSAEIHEERHVKGVDRRFQYDIPFVICRRFARHDVPDHDQDNSKSLGAFDMGKKGGPACGRLKGLMRDGRAIRSSPIGRACHRWPRSR